MIELNINPDWKFKDILEEVQALKTRYDEILALFSCYEIKDKILFRQNVKEKIYALKFEEWKKDKIWEYMNDYEDFDFISKFV